MLLLGAAALGMPAPASAQASYALPFVLTNNHVVISADVNGQGPYNFLLDSGAQANILASSVAAALGLSMQKPVPVNGLGAIQLQAQQTQPVNVDIGGAPLPSQTFLVLDSALQVVKTDQPIQGVIGLPLLQAYSLELNVRQNRAMLFPSSAPPIPRTATEKPRSLPLTFEDNGIALVAAELNGASGMFEIDTGSNATVIVYPAFVAAHADRIVVPQGRSNPSRQLGGNMAFTTLDRADLAIGPVDGTVSPLLVASATPAQAQGNNIAGNIGMGVLKNLDLILDYSNRIMTLAAPQEQTPGIAPLGPQSHN